MSVKEFIREAMQLTRKDLLDNIRDLTAEELAWRPAPHSNSIGFLAWHITRVEDGWIQRPIQRKLHLWVADKWAERFGMPEEQRDMGYGYTVEQLQAFKTPSLELLLGYSQAVRDATLAFLDTWDPASDAIEVRAPWGTMTVATTFQQLIWELNQHGGQIAYVKGIQRGLQRPDYPGPLAPS